MAELDMFEDDPTKAGEAGALEKHLDDLRRRRTPGGADGKDARGEWRAEDIGGGAVCERGTGPPPARGSRP